MAQTKTAVTNLAGMEDILLQGAAVANPTVQTRQSGSIPITPISVALVLLNVVELRTLSPLKCTMAIIKGAVAARDGGHRIFCWNGTSTDADDGVSTLAVVGVATGRWLANWEGSIETGITADVASVQGGYPLTNAFNIISTCANSGDCVTLPPAVAGMEITIVNQGSFNADIFPALAGKLNYLVAENIAISLPVNTSVTYKAIDGTTWQAI